MRGHFLRSSLVAVAMLIVAIVHTADCNKYNYFDDFLFDSLNAGNSVLKPRGKNTQYVSRTANVVARGSGDVKTEPRTTVTPEPSRQENVTAAASTAKQRYSSLTRQSTASSGTEKRRGSAASTKLPSEQRSSREQTAMTTAAAAQATVLATAVPPAIGFGRFKPHRTSPPNRHWTTTAASDEDDDDDNDSHDDDDDDKENDSDMESSGDRSSENHDEDDDDVESSEMHKNRKIVQRKHAKRQSSGVAMRQRGGATNGGRSSIESDLERMRDVPREHWSCCMLGKLAGDKGFDCHAQFYNRRLLDRNVNRAHNRRLSDTYFANGRTTPGAMQLMTLFSTCVRSQAVEFHDCCREALDETMERRERWRRFEEVVAEVRIARQ